MRCAGKLAYGPQGSPKWWVLYFGHLSITYMTYKIHKIRLALTNFFNPEIKQSKDRILSFINANPGKWKVILERADGDKNLAIKLVVFYSWHYINHMRKIFDDFVKELSKPQILTPGFLSLREEFLHKIESVCHEQGLDVKTLSWEARRGSWLRSHEISKLDLNDQEFYSWLLNEFREGKTVSYIKHINDIKNPFTKNEIEKLPALSNEQYLKDQAEQYEEMKQEEMENMMRTMYPKDYDEEGNKITAPDWWPSSPQEYQGWEDSNDKN